MQVTEDLPPPRLIFLDGLRGIAALQVVLVHYASAFLPDLVLGLPPGQRPANWVQAFAQSPFFFLIDGYVSVYIFFLMSGFVLRGAFMKLDLLPLGVWRRLVRLGLPAAAAAALAALAFRLDDHAHFRAAVVSGSSMWLANQALLPPSFVALARDALLNSMLIGYREVSVWPHWAHPAQLSGAFDPPLWTLHLEFVGSMLCLALAFLFRRAAWLGATWLGYAAILFVGYRYGGSVLFLFIIGFALAAVYPRRQAWWLQAAGLACLAGGLWLSRSFPLPVAIHVQTWLRHAHVPAAWPFSGQLAGLLVFLGVLNLPLAQWLLSARPVQWLGHISFGLYLVHFPILGTVGSEVFLLSQPHLGNQLAAFATLAAGLLITLPAALLFTRYIDQPAVRLSRRRLRLHRLPRPA